MLRPKHFVLNPKGNLKNQSENTVLPRLERRRTIKLTRFSLVAPIEGTHYTRDNVMKAQYYTNLVEGGPSTQGDLLIEKSALNEVVRYFTQNEFLTLTNLIAPISYSH